jgi:hypothetical protein
MLIKIKKKKLTEAQIGYREHSSQNISACELLVVAPISSMNVQRIREETLAHLPVY